MSTAIYCDNCYARIEAYPGYCQEQFELAHLESNPEENLCESCEIQKYGPIPEVDLQEEESHVLENLFQSHTDQNSTLAERINNLQTQENQTSELQIEPTSAEGFVDRLERKYGHKTRYNPKPDSDSDSESTLSSVSTVIDKTSVKETSDSEQQDLDTLEGTDQPSEELEKTLATDSPPESLIEFTLTNSEKEFLERVIDCDLDDLTQELLSNN